MKLNNFYIVTLKVHYKILNNRSSFTINNVMFYKLGNSLIDVEFFENKTDLLKIKIENIFKGDNVLISKKFSGNFISHIELVNEPIKLFDTNNTIDYNTFIKLRDRYEDIYLDNSNNVIKSLRKEYKYMI